MPATTQPRRIGRSIWAVAAGFITVFVLSLGTDQLFHMLNVYPPWNQPMNDTGDNALALSYRLIYDTLGSYITAALAPRLPMRHVWIGAAIGLVLSGLGAVAAVKMAMGPVWYPVALCLSTIPTAWIGGTLWMKRNASSASGT